MIALAAFDDTRPSPVRPLWQMAFMALTLLVFMDTFNADRVSALSALAGYSA